MNDALCHFTKNMCAKFHNMPTAIASITSIVKCYEIDRTYTIGPIIESDSSLQVIV